MKIEIKKYTFKEFFDCPHDDDYNSCEECKEPWSKLYEKDPRGVYLFFDNKHNVFYIGESLCLGNRLEKHCPSYYSTEITKKVDENKENGYLVIIFIRMLQIDDVERNLISSFAKIFDGRLLNTARNWRAEKYSQDIFEENTKPFENEIEESKEINEEVKKVLLKAFGKKI